jgi:hypothetical protein
MIRWQKGETFLVWNNQRIETAKAVSSACEPPEGGLCITTFESEGSPKQTNALFKKDASTSFREIKICEDGEVLKFLSVFIQNGQLVLKGDNDFDYYLEPSSFKVVDRRYYR